MCVHVYMGVFILQVLSQFSISVQEVFTGDPHRGSHGAGYRGKDEIAGCPVHSQQREGSEV